MFSSTGRGRVANAGGKICCFTNRCMLSLMPFAPPSEQVITAHGASNCCPGASGQQKPSLCTPASTRVSPRVETSAAPSKLPE